MRVSKSTLQMELKWLNELLGRPTTLLNDAGEMNVGHLYLDKDSGGYKLEEIVDEHGGAHNISGRMRSVDMALYMSGLKNGVALRNAQLNESN